MVDNFNDVSAGKLEHLGRQDFVTRIDRIVQLMSEHPQIFRHISDDNLIREAVVTK